MNLMGIDPNLAYEDQIVAYGFFVQTGILVTTICSIIGYNYYFILWDLM